MQKRTPKPRPGGFRPTIETLESRMQPGTVLGLGGAALDLSAGAALDNTPSASDVSLQRLISHDSDAGLRVGHGDAGAVVTYQAAPGQVSTVSTATVQTGSQFGLPVQDQLRAAGTVAAQAQFRSSQASQGGLRAEAAPAMRATPAAAPVMNRSAATVSPLTNLVATQHVSHGNVVTNDVQPVYISFNGTADGPSTTNGIRALADNSAVTGGTVTDPATGGTDAFIAVISPDGSMRNAVTLASGAGDNLTVNQVAVGGDSAIYFIGNDVAADGSTTQVLVGRLSTAGSLDWAFTLNNQNGTQDQGNGIQVYGNIMYITGGLDQTLGARGTSTDMLVGRINNLSDQPPTADDIAYIATLGFNGPVPSLGKSVAAGSSPTSNAYYAGALGLDAAGSDTGALFGVISADLTTTAFASFNPGAGDTGHGSENSVDVAPDGTFVLAGQINLPSAILGSQQLPAILISRWDFDGTTFNTHYSIQGQSAQGILWFLVDQSMNQNASWIATGNAALTIPPNGQAMNSYAIDPASGLGGQILFRVDATGGNPLDANLIGVPGGANDDQSTGIAVNGADYFLAGKTNSDDFLTTPNAFQPDSPFPGDYNGWVARLNIT